MCEPFMAKFKHSREHRQHRVHIFLTNCESQKHKKKKKLMIAISLKQSKFISFINHIIEDP